MSRSRDASIHHDVGTAADEVPLNSDLGTAATANVTTWASDTTAGRLLRVGDFGLGDTNGANVTDLNTVPATGLNSFGFPSANRPSIITDGTVQTITYNTGYTSQLAISVVGSVVCMRYKNSGNWTAWNDIYHTGSTFDGIKFPATQVPSADANTLDDYEEGTWTPAFSCSGGTWTPAGATAGRYVKIGNAVHISGTLIGGMSGARTGDVTITGFPFTCAAIPGYGQGMALAVSTNFQGENPRVIRVMANATYAKPYYYADLAGSPLITQGEDLSSVATYNILSFSGTYLI